MRASDVFYIAFLNVLNRITYVYENEYIVKFVIFKWSRTEKCISTYLFWILSITIMIKIELGKRLIRKERKKTKIYNKL